MMEAQDYYLTLIQQGHTPVDAAHYTCQYYPEFKPPTAGAEMIATPFGSSEFVGLSGQGGAVSATGAGSITAGTVAAGAATGGGMSVATIAVVSVLVLGGAGTAGYFIYDYLTEPDFYGTIYWQEFGAGYQFEEDTVYLVFPAIEDNCDYFETAFSETNTQKRGELCYIDSPFGDFYSIEERDDYFLISFSDEKDTKDRIMVYPLERGAVMTVPMSDGCDVWVSDIEAPMFSYATLEGFGEMEDWRDEFEDIAEEIKEDGPSKCDYSYYDEDSYADSPSSYEFDFSDASDWVSNATDDDLIHVQMTKGDDVSWAALGVSIILDGGDTIACEDGKLGGGELCTFTSDDDGTWSLGERITISENDVDLCDGSTGGCQIDVILTNIRDDVQLAYIYAYAE